MHDRQLELADFSNSGKGPLMIGMSSFRVMERQNAMDSIFRLFANRSLHHGIGDRDSHLSYSVLSRTLEVIEARF